MHRSRRVVSVCAADQLPPNRRCHQPLRGGSSERTSGAGVGAGSCGADASVNSAVSAAGFSTGAGEAATGSGWCGAGAGAAGAFSRHPFAATGATTSSDCGRGVSVSGSCAAPLISHAGSPTLGSAALGSARRATGMSSHAPCGVNDGSTWGCSADGSAGEPATTPSPGAPSRLRDRPPRRPRRRRRLREPSPSSDL